MHAKRLAVLESCYLAALAEAVEQQLLSQAEHQQKEQLHEQVVLDLQAGMALLSQQSSEQLQAQVSPIWLPITNHAIHNCICHMHHTLRTCPVQHARKACFISGEQQLCPQPCAIALHTFRRLQLCLVSAEVLDIAHTPAMSPCIPLGVLSFA